MLCCRVECRRMLAGHLTTWILLLLMLLLPPLTLAQNHTCHRTETTEVKVAVPIQEPVTFRSYTWCLKVPPRCSKYTVVMRERVTYQIEVRNLTVTECCAGHVSLYGTCVPACKTCINMLCNTTACVCAPGYVGPQCNQTCKIGMWGDRCLETCICRVGEDCDHSSGGCTESTSTTLQPTTAKALPSTTHPSLTTINSTLTTASTTSQPTRQTLTTSNTFIDLSQTHPTTSAEDLSDFNLLLKTRVNDSVRLVNNNDENSLNALGDMDYPVLPTDSAMETFNNVQPENEPTKNIVVNSLNVNGSVMNDRWISELGAHSGVTVGSVLALIALLVVTVSAAIRFRNKKTAQHQMPVEKNGLHLVARNSHYAIPGPPPFSFLNGYGGTNLARELNEDTYDHPRNVRCLVVNEPVYDELRY